jgi:hypothetical protein
MVCLVKGSLVCNLGYFINTLSTENTWIFFGLIKQLLLSILISAFVPINCSKVPSASTSFSDLFFISTVRPIAPCNLNLGNLGLLIGLTFSISA